AEYDQKVKAGELPKAFIDKSNLQVKLQQAQFLARLYSEKASEKTRVTDEEVAKYIAEHPELNIKGTPGSPGKSVKDSVREKLQADKEKQNLDKIVVDNNIQVPLDFDIPEVTKQ